MAKEKRDVAVVGVGHTKFGRHLNKSLVDLFGEAAMEAIHDAGVDRKKIEAVYMGQHAGAITDGTTNIGGFMAEEIGLRGIPSLRFEGACASSAIALREAYREIAAGYHDIMLVGGTERLLSAGTPVGTKGLASAVDGIYESNAGLTFPGVFGIAARLYAIEYGIPLDDLREKMAHVSIKNHGYGAKNPLAQFYQKMGNLTVDDVLNSRMICSPLTLMDCCPMTDGATACVIAEGKIAEKMVDKPIYILGAGEAGAGGIYRQRVEMIRPITRIKSSQAAFKEAGLTPDDVDLVEIHDCFTIAEIIASEALGFFEFGEGADAVAEGKTKIGGKIPINPSGGLMGKGHPVGATGTSQIYLVTKQLRGDMEPLPEELHVHGAEVGITDTLGGDFSTLCNVILSTKRRGE
jgi:acetyl-CoA C-acetyltransferase/acetyl-CoA acyltransferase